MSFRVPRYVIHTSSLSRAPARSERVGVCACEASATHTHTHAHIHTYMHVNLCCVCVCVRLFDVLVISSRGLSIIASRLTPRTRVARAHILTRGATQASLVYIYYIYTATYYKHARLLTASNNVTSCFFFSCTYAVLHILLLCGS